MPIKFLARGNIGQPAKWRCYKCESDFSSLSGKMTRKGRKDQVASETGQEGGQERESMRTCCFSGQQKCQLWLHHSAVVDDSLGSSASSVTSNPVIAKDLLVHFRRVVISVQEAAVAGCSWCNVPNATLIRHLHNTPRHQNRTTTSEKRVAFTEGKKERREVCVRLCVCV